MRRLTCAIACASAATFALAACDRTTTAATVTVPSASVLSPESARHMEMKFSPDGRLVAYFMPGTNGFDLMVAKGDLSEPRRLTTVRSTNGLYWSPDESKLAYSGESGASVAVVTLADGTVRRLTSGKNLGGVLGWHPRGDRVTYLNFGVGGAFGSATASVVDGTTAKMVSDSLPNLASWSPDGTRIAYVRLQGGRLTLWVADSSGGNARALTTEGFENFNLYQSPWSPDGTRIVYTSYRTGAVDIWVIPVAGGAALQLTRDIRVDELPVWSPDGQWIAFVSTRGRQTDVWVVPATGGEAVRVTDDPREESDLQWIGSGLTVGFSRSSSSRSLWAVDMAGNGERQLTPDSIRIGDFRPSPVNDDIAYVVQRGGGVSELRVMSHTTGGSRTLVAGSSTIRDAVWSPDGKTLAFESDPGGNPDIWTVNAAGGEPRQLTTWSGLDRNPTWSLDGSALYFMSDKESKLDDLWSVPAGGGQPTRLTTVGTVNNSVAVSPIGELFLPIVNGRTGQVDVAKLTTNGTLQVLWDRGNVLTIPSLGFTPRGDSLVIVSTVPDGGRGTFIISTRTGQGRRILGDNELGADLTPDGTHLIYRFGSPKVDLGLYNLRDGTTRRLTNAKESQAQFWLSHDGKTLLATRSVSRQAIVTVDLRATLAKAR